MDPSQVLNDELMVHIFSFVGGRLAKVEAKIRTGTSSKSKAEDEEAYEYIEEEVTDEEAERLEKEQRFKKEEKPYLNVVEAGRYYVDLARVSRGWKRIIDSSIHRLAADIHLDNALNGTSQQIESCIKWLCTHRMKIASIVATYGNGAHYFGNNWKCYSQLLQCCDTSQLTELAITLLHIRDLRVEMTARQLLDQVAEQCPSLETAYVYISAAETVSSNDVTLISPAFFGMSSLRTLHLGFAIEQGANLDAQIVSKMVEGLPNLEHLLLNSYGRPTLGGDTAYISFPIRSQSLKQILAENFTKHVKLTLDCPKLEFFRCKGFVGMTADPATPPDRIALQQQVIRADNVPDSCCALVIHVCNPYGPPIGFPFRFLLGPSVSLLPLRNHHR